jgi:hypothetical protein
MNGPLMRAGRAKAIDRQISAFSDAHAGVANQHKGIAAEIVATQEFLLQELILFDREWPWDRSAWLLESPAEKTSERTPSGRFHRVQRRCHP